MNKETLVCSILEARKGCIAIANHVLGLTNASREILASPTSDPGRNAELRAAYILTLIAFEETGKLFMIWQIAADAERSHQETVRIEEIEYHAPKGDLAGDLCCQMLEFSEQEIADAIESGELTTEGNPWLGLMDYVLLSTLKGALEVHRERIHRIKRDFNREREEAMYVDFRRGSWKQDAVLSHNMLVMDCLLFSVVAEVAKLYLMDGRPFSLATKALVDLREKVRSVESEEFLSIVQRMPLFHPVERPRMKRIAE